MRVKYKGLSFKKKIIQFWYHMLWKLKIKKYIMAYIDITTGFKPYEPKHTITILTSIIHIIDIMDKDVGIGEPVEFILLDDVEDEEE